MSSYGYGSSPLEILACTAMVQGLIYMDEFSYSTTWLAGTTTALGEGGDVTTNIQINSDSDFVAQEYNLSMQIAAGDSFVVLPSSFSVQLTRAGSGRNIMNEPQLVGNLCGNYAYAVQSPTIQSANQSGRLPTTALYQGNSTVSVRLQNPTEIIPFKIQFTMRGFKVFYQTNAQGITGNRQSIFHAL